MSLTKTHAMQMCDDSANPLERAQLASESMVSRALQDCRTHANRPSSSWAARPCTARSASMLPSLSSAFLVYTAWNATLSANATSAQPWPFCNIRTIRYRFFAASLNRL